MLYLFSPQALVVFHNKWSYYQSQRYSQLAFSQCCNNLLNSKEIHLFTIALCRVVIPFQNVPF